MALWQWAQGTALPRAVAVHLTSLYWTLPSYHWFASYGAQTSRPASTVRASLVVHIGPGPSNTSFGGRERSCQLGAADVIVFHRATSLAEYAMSSTGGLCLPPQCCSRTVHAPFRMAASFDAVGLAVATAQHERRGECVEAGRQMGISTGSLWIIGSQEH